jgi:D-glycero-alpha-D-manno-heptose 1-phosphate guanylyltransferase
MIHEAIILAGGFGTRLGLLTKETPKPLLPVAGRPFIFHLFDYLLENKIKKVILATGFLAEKFSEPIGNKYRHLDIEYSKEDSPLGTGGAIAKAMQFCQSETPLVFNGDTYFPVSLTEMEKVHRNLSLYATLALRKVPDSGRYGSVVLEENTIVSIQEKGNNGEGLVNGGVYLIDRQKLLETSPGEVFSFEKEILPRWIAERQVAGVPSSSYFIDIGIPADYQRAQNELR